DLNDWTPELHAEALELIKQYRIGPLFTPPSVADANNRGTMQIPGNQGSDNWQGASWDPETSMFYVPSVTNLSVQALQAGGTRSDMNLIGGAGGAVPTEGGAAGAGGGGAGGGGRGGRTGGPGAAAAPGAAGPRGGGGGGGGRGRGGPVQLGPGVSRGPWGIGP